MSEQTTDELAVLLREGSTVQIRDRAVRVAPITMKHLSPFARAVLPIAHAIAPEGGEAPTGEAAPNLAGVDLTRIKWSELVLWHGPDCIVAVSLATGEPEEWLGELMPDEMVMLIAEVVAVNMSFFVQRLAPAIKAAMGRIGEASGKGGAKAGATPGKSSSPTDTAAAT